MTNFITETLRMPLVASEHGGEIDQLIWYVHLLMGVLLVGWLTYFLYAIFRFNKSRHPKADHVGVRGHASNYIEGIVALIEAVLLIGFAVPIWAHVVNEPPEEEGAVKMQVTGRQFNWTARYAGPDGEFGAQALSLVSGENPLGVDTNDPKGKDDVVVVNDIVIPVDRDMIIDITSLDVIHCFAVKPMRVTQDAIPGMRIPVWFKAVREGNYMIQCAQLCGNSHYAMRGNLNVVSQDDFDTWLAERVTPDTETVDYE